MAIYSMMFMGMAPVGALLAGLLADRLGAGTTVALGGVFCIGGGLFLLWQLPGIREDARRLILDQQSTALPQSPAGAEPAPAPLSGGSTRP